MLMTALQTFVYFKPLIMMKQKKIIKLFFSARCALGILSQIILFSKFLIFDLVSSILFLINHDVLQCILYFTLFAHTLMFIRRKY